MRDSVTLIRFAFAALLTIAILGCSDTGDPDPPAQAQRRPESFRTKFSALMRSRNYAAADQLLTQKLTATPDNSDLLLLAARLSVAAGDLEEADQRYQSLFRTTDSIGDEVQMEWVKVWCDSGKVMRAIDHLQGLNNRSSKLTRMLGQLQMIVGDLRGAEIAYRQLLGPGVIQSGELFSLACTLGRSQREPAIIAAALRANPNDLRPTLAAAVDDWLAVREDAAIETLQKLVDRHPDYAPAVGTLSFLLADTLDLEGLAELISRTPPRGKTHPWFWYGVGVLHSQRGQSELAADGLLRAIEGDPNARLAVTKLAPVLGRLGKPELAETVAADASLRQQLRLACRAFASQPQGSQTLAVTIGQRLADLNRHREATQWFQLAQQFRAEPIEAPERLAEMAGRSAGQSDRPAAWIAEVARMLPDRDEAALLAVAEVDVDVDPDSESVWLGGSDRGAQAGRVVFRDEAQSRGLSFSFRHAAAKSNRPTAKLGQWLHQTSGGGIGVGDFDLNGWDDLVLTQAGVMPMQSTDLSKTNDAAKRGLSDRWFLNFAGDFVPGSPIESKLRYGQGVAVGDVNGDGFPDLCVGNIGENRLLINRGDGTFRDASEAAGISGALWTSSVAMADINEDGHPDLIEISYCGGEVFQRPCHEPNGDLTACLPASFPPVADRMWLSKGDGTFAVDTTWSEAEPLGRGLGLLIAELDGRPGLDVFVANDMTANHFWSRDADNRWKESAAIRGLGFGADGRPQACMGIAAADLDDDADLDLLVTNYSDENNAYYVQADRGFYQDETVRSGLAGPSFPMLGFGTVAADFDGDGRHDLFVANGLVNRNQNDGEPFKQPAQLFRRIGGRWLLDQQPGGDYFASAHVGRAVAKGDFNSDGAIDLVVGHLGDPTSLLINQSPTDHGFAIRLIGARERSRDAVGAVLHIRTNQRTLTVQRVAGDGYLASHTAWLTGSLRPDESIEQAEVTWPSGGQTDLVDVEPGQRWCVTATGETWMVAG